MTPVRNDIGPLLREGADVVGMEVRQRQLMKVGSAPQPGSVSNRRSSAAGAIGLRKICSGKTAGTSSFECG